MKRTVQTKTISLVISIICLIISVLTSAFDGFNIGDFGICKGSSILSRLLYSFFHASIPHALINCWCLLSIAFLYDLSLTSLFIAYITAITFPIDTLAAAFPAASPATAFPINLPALVLGGFPAEIPTVGLSAVCFSLLGQVSFQVKRKCLFHVWVISFIAIGFILPPICSVCGYAIATPNNLLHIYCYVAGLFVGFLNSPANESHHARMNGREQRRVIKDNSPAHEEK